MYDAVVVCVCIASAVITLLTRSNASSRVRRAGISLLLRATCTWPRTTPAVWSRAATRCGAVAPAAFAPRTVLPSIAMTCRPASFPTRVRIHAPISLSRRSPSRAVNARRIVASEGPRQRPHAPSSPSTSGSTSSAHSPIAANDRAPAITAAKPTARITANRWRTPRRWRGSGTSSSSDMNVGRARAEDCSTDAGAAGEDDKAGVGSSADRLCQNSHPHRADHARTSTHPACHATKPQITALPARLCRAPAAVADTLDHPKRIDLVSDLVRRLKDLPDRLAAWQGHVDVLGE